MQVGSHFVLNTVFVCLLLFVWCVDAYFCSVEYHGNRRQHGFERAKRIPLLLLCAQPCPENSQVKRSLKWDASFGVLEVEESHTFEYFTEWWEKMRTHGGAHWAAGEFTSRGFRRMSSGTGPQMGGSPSPGSKIKLTYHTLKHFPRSSWYVRPFCQAATILRVKNQLSDQSMWFQC